MTLPTISPAEAKRLIDEGAVLVDVRDRAEHARERIPQARNFALSEFEKGELPRDGANVVLFHCKSGMRTLSNAQALSDKAGDACDALLSKAASMPGARPACRWSRISRSRST